MGLFKKTNFVSLRRSLCFRQKIVEVYSVRVNNPCLFFLKFFLYLFFYELMNYLRACYNRKNLIRNNKVRKR